MPVRQWSSVEARSHLFSNPVGFWSNASSTGLPNHRTAVERLAGDVFEPDIRPKFQIAADTPMFAIGSCFARALEESLRPRGFVIESYRDDDFAEFAADTRTDLRHTPDGPIVDLACREITNKYNTFSMVQHLEWVFDTEVPPASTFLPTDDGRVQDPHICPIHRLADVELTLRRRRAMTPVIERLAHCGLLVVTLGLTEAWFDVETGLYLNATPDRAAFRKSPNRFVFRTTSFQDNRDALERLLSLVRRVSPGIKVLVTVSPVALAATFRPDDVVVANMASKATLRTVAEEFVAAHDGVDYFPSFELVMFSNQAVVRKADRSHVPVDTSRAIIDLFARHYIVGAAA